MGINMAKKKKFRLKKWLIMFGSLLLAGVCVFLGIQLLVTQTAKSYILKDVEDLPESDAVMVLGAFVFKSGRPSDLLADRLDYGFEVYSAGKAKKIIVSGDHGQHDYDEVNSMKDYLMEKGVPREDIFLDHAGFNTYDSMYRAKAVFGVETLLVSTQEFHIDRAVYIARSMGIDAYGYPCDDKPKYYPMTQLKLRESLARVKAVLDTATSRKPKYLGEAIPISGNGILTEG